jgi:hypothetical protein
MDFIRDLVNPFDGNNPLLNYTDNLLGAIIPGQQGGEDDDVSTLGMLGSIGGGLIGGPTGAFIGSQLGNGLDNALGRGNGSSGGGGACGMPNCYQTCQAKDRKAQDQAKKSIEKFVETMKARGVIITGCKVRTKVKTCGRPVKKATACKRQTTKGSCSKTKEVLWVWYVKSDI